MRPLLLSLALVLGACAGESDPFPAVDARYADIMARLGAAERDTARNVRNKEARQRLSDAEQERVAFFRSEAVQKAIAAGDAAPAGSPQRVKAEQYRLQALKYRPWTEAEKAEETRLLGALEEVASREATWASADGQKSTTLTGGWDDVSEVADAMPAAARGELFAAYIDHQMEVVGEDLQALVTLRNTVAKREGYDNYWQLSLATSGLTPGDVDELLAELRPVIDPANAATRDILSRTALDRGVELSAVNLPYLRREAGLEAAAGEADAVFDADLAEERITRAFQEMGLPTSGWQVYVEPRRHARPGVYGFPIRPPETSAIVISQEQRWSMWPYEALAHEGGHAIWWSSLTAAEAASPALWSPPEPWFEGFAYFFERLVYEPSFLARYAPEAPEALREKLRHYRARKVADWITDSMVDTLVERKLYEDPTDLAAITRYAAETRASLTGLPLAPSTEAGLAYDGALLSSLVWNYPGYAQNFLYAYMTECWLYDAVVSAVGDPAGNPRVGPLLQEKIIRAPVGTPFPDRISALKPGQGRAEALKAYLELPQLAAATSVEVSAAAPAPDAAAPANPEAAAPSAPN